MASLKNAILVSKDLLISLMQEIDRAKCAISETKHQLVAIAPFINWEDKAYGEEIVPFAAYAAKQPAPAPDGWEPKVGDRVLVEAEVVDAVDEYGEATIDLCSVKPMYFPRCVVNRSAIVGPAPVREPGPKFSFGQDALYVPAMEKVIVNHFIGFGKYDVYRMGHESFTAHEDDLLTLDEARERLGKK